MKEYDRTLKQPSRDLRKHLTDAEQALWRRIRRKQLFGVQLYRQKPLVSFIVEIPPTPLFQRGENTGVPVKSAPK